MFTQVEAIVDDSRAQTFYLTRPEMVANPKSARKGMPQLSPFWNAAFVGEESEVDGLVDLKFCRQAFTVALQVNSKNQKNQDDQFKNSNKGGSKTIITLHYLTNPIEVKIGQRLRAPTGGSIVKSVVVD